MTCFLRPAILAMAGYTPGEQPCADGIIKLNTNENPYPPSPRVQTAIEEYLSSGRLRKYPDPLGTAFLNSAAKVLGIDPEGILIGNGSDDILTILTRAFVPEGGLVVSPTPSYLLYKTLADIQGARFQTVPFTRDWDLPAPPRPCPEANLTLIANPNSPTATLVGLPGAGIPGQGPPRARWSLTRLTSISRRTHALGLSRLPGVIVTRTLSKSYSLAGLRFGFAVTQPGAGAGAHQGQGFLKRMEVNPAAVEISLVGLFHTLAFSAWPAHAPFTVYAALQDGLWEGTMELFVMHLETEGDAFIAYDEVVRLPPTGGLTFHAGMACAPSASFRAPGRYLVAHFDWTSTVWAALPWMSRRRSRRAMNDSPQGPTRRHSRKRDCEFGVGRARSAWKAVRRTTRFARRPPHLLPPESPNYRPLGPRAKPPSNAQTGETRIDLSLALDGTGKTTSAQTGVGFFDHMLELLERHSLIDLNVQAEGDLQVDSASHCRGRGNRPGQALDKALGDKRGIFRYGWAIVPMDETLAEGQDPPSGRPAFVYNVKYFAGATSGISPSNWSRNSSRPSRSTESSIFYTSITYPTAEI